MPLVLVSNDANASNRYAWKDITGVQYHYPNNYRNIIRTNERFVYYRGIRRADGGRDQAEYFGCGTIGEVWRDLTIPTDTPKRKWAWYCRVEDYLPFTLPVPSKVEGTFFEKISSNMWRVGVRKLSEITFEEILRAAGISASSLDVDSSLPSVELPSLSTLSIEEVTTELIALRPVAAKNVPDDLSVSRGFGAMRRARNAKVAGDRAEEIALRYIQEAGLGAIQVRHVSIAGETPGWDIEYTNADGELVAVEVKGSSGTAFPNFELTKGELEAARGLGHRYWIYLVANCLGTCPQLQRIQDPAKLLKQQVLCAEPIIWRVWRSS